MLLEHHVTAGLLAQMPDMQQFGRRLRKFQCNDRRNPPCDLLEATCGPVTIHGAPRCGHHPWCQEGAIDGLPWVKPSLSGRKSGPCILRLWTIFRLVEATLIITVAPLSFLHIP